MTSPPILTARMLPNFIRRILGSISTKLVQRNLICAKTRSLGQIIGNTSSWNVTKLRQKHPWVNIYQSCKKKFGWSKTRSLGQITEILQMTSFPIQAAGMLLNFI